MASFLAPVHWITRGMFIFALCSTALPTTAEDPARAPAGPAAPSASQFKPPTPRSAGERVDERRRMVEQQLSGPTDTRAPITEQRVLDAMLAVPRHAFMPANVRAHAYEDMALPIGHGQTISQPYIVALMTQHLDVKPDSKVLEIGTGSGYQAAVLAHLTPHVYSIEIVEPLAKRAAAALKEQGYTSVQAKAGDGYKGWPEHAPFDAIIVTCAPEDVPRPLWDQLKPNGRIVIPVGPARRVQRLVVITKSEDGRRRTQTITDVQFVPMTRSSRR